MKAKNATRVAMLVAAGFWMSWAGTSAVQAASESAGKPLALSKFVKHRHHHRHGLKHSAKRHTSKSERTAAQDKPAEAAAKDSKRTADATPGTLPESIANANAQMPQPEPSPAAAQQSQAPQAQAQWPTPQPAQAAPAEPVQTAVEQSPTPPQSQDVVAPDQLNDVDRAMAASNAAPSAAAVPVETTAPAINVAAHSNGETVTAPPDQSSWSKASLVGKIFIGFGGLLTLASAVRMFVA